MVGVRFYGVFSEICVFVLTCEGLCVCVERYIEAI